MSARSVPVFLNDAAYLWEEIQRLDPVKQKAMWKCSDKLAKENRQRFEETDLSGDGAPLPAWTPALLAYEGIQYQYMAPKVFSQDQWEYVEKHLNILSGLYGILRPLDGVVPYRLEMQAKASEAGDLYRFWGEKLYREITDRDKKKPVRGSGEGEEGQKSAVILNLASKEYSRCIEKYLQPEDAFLTVTFGELIGGKVKQKGTFAKMARGEMVRYLAEHQVEEPERIKSFDRLGYHFAEEQSTEKEYVFLKQKE